MTLSRRTVLWSMIALLSAGGCRSSGEPLGLLLRGTFVLRTVAGAPLPADVSSQTDYQITLLADTLRFDGQGLAKMGRTERVQHSTAAPIVDHSTADFAVRIVGDAIYLDFLCPPGADCFSSGPIVGHLADANTLVLGDSKPYVYVRP
jgi:hypothetical protein